MAFEFTDKQKGLLSICKEKKNIMAYGGSRSGKTFALVYAVATRAITEPNSRHLIARFRFNHVKQSVVMDTFPTVMKLAYPNLPYEISKTDWYAKLPNGSEIWFGGLDDSNRVEKILGNEYSTIYLNECSQVSEQAKNMVKTRLAQKTGLKNKMYYDCNPPSKRHWTYKDFIDNPTEDSGALLLNPADNITNISDDYLEILNNLPPTERARFMLGEFADVVEGAYYAAEIKAAEASNRITGVMADPLLKTHTVWDIGVGDNTTIIFYQLYGNEIRIVNCFTDFGKGLPYYVEKLDEYANLYGYKYDRHIAPHDIAVREFGSGASRIETGMKLGINFEIAPNLKIYDGIDAVRNVFQRCWFDKNNTSELLDALREYREDKDSRTGESKERPLHDWTSHFADAFRYLAVSIQDEIGKTIQNDPYKNYRRGGGTWQG